MAALPVTIAGTAVAAVGVVSLTAELMIKVFNDRGMATGGLTPSPGETSAQLQERSLALDTRLRVRFARLRRWAIAAVVVGIVVVVVGSAV